MAGLGQPSFEVAARCQSSGTQRAPDRPRPREGYVAISHGVDSLLEETPARVLAFEMHTHEAWTRPQGSKRWSRWLYGPAVGLVALALILAAVAWRKGRQERLAQGGVSTLASKPPTFQKVSHGTCKDSGSFPIHCGDVCTAAAMELGLADTSLTVGSVEDRPEGCYYFFNGQDGTGSLWLNSNPSSKGKGAETSDLGTGLFRLPLCGTKSAVAPCKAHDLTKMRPSAEPAEASCKMYACASTFRPSHACQCNPECIKFNSCCSDFRAQCTPHRKPAAPSPAAEPSTQARPVSVVTRARQRRRPAAARPVADDKPKAEDKPKAAPLAAWRCIWPKGVDIRRIADISGPLTGKRLEHGTVFNISREFEGIDGVVYLKLADGRGWVFDREPALGRVCRKEAKRPAAHQQEAGRPAARLAPLREATAPAPARLSGAGCFLHSGEGIPREIAGELRRSSTTASCAQACAGHSHIGLSVQGAAPGGAGSEEPGKSCVCLDELPAAPVFSHVPASFCGSLCDGEAQLAPHRYCGGADTVATYRLGPLASPLGLRLR